MKQTVVTSYGQPWRSVHGSQGDHVRSEAAGESREAILVV